MADTPVSQFSRMRLWLAIVGPDTRAMTRLKGGVHNDTDGRSGFEEDSRLDGYTLTGASLWDRVRIDSDRADADCSGPRLQ
jgi:hypothetical protein